MDPFIELKPREMPPRRSRRTAGKDPALLEEVEKNEGKPGGENDGLGKTVDKGKKINADNVVQLEGAAIEEVVGSTEEKVEVDIKETVVTSKSIKEGFGKQNSVEKLEDTEASCCGGIRQVGDGKEVATNSEKDAQNACRLGDHVEPGPSRGQASHLQITKKVASSSRRLNASSSEEEFYSGEEEVIIFLLILLRASSVCIKFVG